MDELLAHLEDAKTQYSDTMIYSPHLINSINPAWSHLAKYYGLVDLEPSLYGAVALHPDMKLKYFCDEWKARPEWIQTAVFTATQLWEKNYSYHRLDIDEPDTQNPYNLQSELPQSRSEIRQLPRWKPKKHACLSEDDCMQDQFQQFQLDTHHNSEYDLLNLIQFWWERLESPRWAQLARIALSIHSIPAMSAEVEGVFSSSKILITDRRNRLGDNVIGAVDCLKLWEKTGLIQTDEISEVTCLLQVLENKTN